MVSSKRPAKRARKNNIEPSADRDVHISIPGPKLKARYSFETETDNSEKLGKFALNWLLNPISTEHFFSSIFEKQPKHVKSNPEKFRDLISFDDIKTWLCDGKLCYGKDIDVTRYKDSDGRSTLNGESESVAGQEALKHFETGASIRLLRPPVQSDAIYHLCAHLEDYLECVVGANVYLTPVGHQGFAPHFDDIDAFICQVAGRKHWRVYEPLPEQYEKLPRQSSIDFSRDDVADRKLAIDAVLEPGDMLYLPRGAIHEARCLSSEDESDDDIGYSLHVTVSMFQKWTWADLLSESIQHAVRSAAVQDVHLRRTLPMKFGRFSGVAHAGHKDLNEWFFQKVGAMARIVTKKYPTDNAADLMAVKFLQERLPPVWVNEHRQHNSDDLKGNSCVRAVCRNIGRLVMDVDGWSQGMPRLVTCSSNRRDRGKLDVSEDGSINCLPEEAGAVNDVLMAYPRSIRVRDLDIPTKSIDDKITLAEGLIEMGLLVKVKYS